jgi:hypothetical protein
MNYNSPNVIVVHTSHATKAERMVHRIGVLPNREKQHQ